MRMIRIFDTTLRDGEQSPGCSMNAAEKLRMARQLEKLRVDVMEAGFAASSPGDFASVKEIADTIKEVSVCSLARALKSDIESAADALRNAVDPRIHTFIATSPIHMEYKLAMTPDQVIDTAVEAVKLSRKYVSNVEFSAEDATRSDVEFLAKIFDAVIAAGATTINIPDTVGYTVPDEFVRFITDIRNACPALDNVDISVHCHNDLGLAVANSLASLNAGINQIECTVNGIGERAGNCSLEEVVMAMKTRMDFIEADTRIVTTEIMGTSQLLTNITGVRVQPNKAIVGENAFAHEAGIHQDGVLKNKQTYEILTPESIGITEKSLVLGKHSGKAALRNRLSELGFEVNDEELQVAFEKFKKIADKKKEVHDSDIEAMMTKEAIQVPKTYTLHRFVVNSGNTITPTSVVSLIKDNRKVEKVGRGDGPIDASFHAIEQIVGKKLHLEDFQLQAITEGKDSLGDATISISEEKDGRKVVKRGRGLSTDVVEACINAYIEAVNKLIHEEDMSERIHAQL